MFVLVSGRYVSSLTAKRILSEWKEVNDQKLSLDIPFCSRSSDEIGIRLSPLKNNLLEWHFSFTGIKGSDYEDGIYHGVIHLDREYPRKAPRIAMLSPNGRWAVNRDICLSGNVF
jgi:ubiquitin-protein ligase